MTTDLAHRRPDCDVLIIGGGVNGTGLARDLSLRGLRVILQAAARRLELGEGHPTLTVGRADETDLVVKDDCISRLHARGWRAHGQHAAAHGLGPGECAGSWRE